MTDLITIYHSISGYGLPFAMFLALVALERGWVVFKREADALRSRIKELEVRCEYAVNEKEEWKEVAMTGKLTAHKAISAARLATEQL